MQNNSMLRIGLITALSGIVPALFLMWALHPHVSAVHHILTKTQQRAYEEGFGLCYQRVIAGANPQGNVEWNAVLHRFEICTAALGVPFRTKWEPEENKWRYEIAYPEQAAH